MSTGPAIVFRGVEKRYGATPVLRGVSLEVRGGEYLGLVGVNGAGKTTLIKALLDFCRIDAGEITIRGVTHTRTAARMPVAFVPERFLAPYFATGRDFLAFMARLYGPGFDRAGIDALCAALDLEPAALARPVRALSKGMAQKIGLLCCLASGRPLRVMDEPFSGLDPKARALLKRHLLEDKRRGNTLFFTTHSLVDVEALCDRVAVLHGGRLAWIGAVDAFRRVYGATTLEQAYLRCVA